MACDLVLCLYFGPGTSQCWSFLRFSPSCLTVFAHFPVTSATPGPPGLEAHPPTWEDGVAVCCSPAHLNGPQFSPCTQEQDYLVNISI